MRYEKAHPRQEVRSRKNQPNTLLQSLSPEEDEVSYQRQLYYKRLFQRPRYGIEFARRMIAWDRMLREHDKGNLEAGAA